MKTDPSYPNLRHSLLLVMVALALQIAFAIPLAVLGVVLKARVVESPWSLGVMNLLAFGLVLAWGCWYTGVPWRELYPLRAVPALVWPAVAVGQLGILVVGSELDNLVRYLLPPPAFITELFAGLSGSGDAWVGPFFALVLVAPLTEEPLFRGLILRGLLRRGSVSAAIVFSALLFGLMHLNPWQSCTTMVMGVLLGWWTVRSGSLLPALAAHAFNNSGVLWHRSLPFQIPGFNDAEVMATAARFQPWWFDLLGVCLLMLGVFWFHRVAPRRAPEDKCEVQPGPEPDGGEGNAEEIPPVIGSTDPGSPGPAEGAAETSPRLSGGPTSTGEPPATKGER